MIPKVRFRTCRGRRGCGGHEVIIGEINKESESVGRMVYDAIETYGVREESMGTCTAQEVPANLLI